MAPTLAELVEPGRCALVINECQNGVVGEEAVFPALADAARAAVSAVARLTKAARAANVPVIHAVAHRRADGLGASTNARIFAAAAKSGVVLEPGSDAAAVVDRIGVEGTDIVLARLHGVGPMWGTQMESVLRSLGARTVIASGVSVNVGVTNLIMDCVNAGFQVVLPRDAVAGVPAEYAESIIDNTLSLLATLTTTNEVIASWP